MSMTISLDVLPYMDLQCWATTTKRQTGLFSDQEQEITATVTELRNSFTVKTLNAE